MRSSWLALVLVASCGSSGPVRMTVPPGVYPDVVRAGACHLSDGSVAGDGVAAEMDDDCNVCTCHDGRWECTERDC
jgi:hypothetical protein